MKNDNEKMSLPFSKPKTLHELLKQGSGHNLVLDFSMLSKRGGLIEKAKKYQNINNQKIQSEIINNDKTKISKNFEILSKLGKKKKKNENMNHFQNKEINIINNNIQNELINDFNNKINISKKEVEQDNYENNNNDYISQECLELKYDNPQSDSDKEEKEEKNKLNNKNIKIKKDNDIIKKRKKKNINNYIKNIEIETNSLNDEDNPNTPQILNYSTYTIPEYNQNYNQNKLNNKFHRPFVITKSPNFENEENYYYNNNNNNSIYRSNKKTKKSFLKNQVIEYETIKESYTIKQCNCVLEYSFREDQNIDSETLMEDKSKSIENFNNDKNQMVFEIFDGHGGDEMSTYLQANLAKIYKQNLLLNKGNIILSLKNAFHDADDEMRGQLNMEGLGSTGTLVHIVRRLGPVLEVYSANVGDSRVSLISPEHIIRLSYDHRTTDEKEKKRILESGMEIIDDRICGTLMLTRIFGNYEYKEENENGNNKGLICEPFISKIEIDLSIENQFLILASDGIWDILTEEEVQNIVKKYQDTQKICSIIIKKCLENEAWDNMSVFAVKLT
jgi:serine/threonine protein phosphatase PrpC